MNLEEVKEPGDRTGFINLRAPKLPASIAPFVQSIIGLDSLQRLEPGGLAAGRGLVPRAAQPAGRVSSAGPTACKAASGFARFGSYTASQIAQAYGFSELYARHDLGAGTTVAVVEFEPDSKADLARFARCYGVHTRVTYYPIDGGVPSSGYQTGEAALDTETLMSLAPSITEDVYQTGQSTTDYFDLLDAISRNTSVKVVSMSWGSCELESTPDELAAEAVHLEVSAAEGQTWLVAAGDTGSTGCVQIAGAPIALLAVEDPAAQPFVTAVGGTRLPSDRPFAGEPVWNDVTGAGGGGI